MIQQEDEDKGIHDKLTIITVKVKIKYIKIKNLNNTSKCSPVLPCLFKLEVTSSDDVSITFHGGDTWRQVGGKMVSERGWVRISEPLNVWAT